MTPLELVMPWPPSELSPNARPHWAKLARVKKQYRLACACTARSQGAAQIFPMPSALAVHMQFVPPDRRHRDHDNCVASMKSGLDGLADVLGVDDSRWRLTSELPAAGESIGGFVRIRIEEAGPSE